MEHSAGSETKECTACKTNKPLDDFPPDLRSKKDGKQARCRYCINAWMKEHYRMNPAEQMIRRARTRATKKGIDFDLSVSDITPLPELCPVFGEPLRISIVHQDPWAYSLDRIDNGKGYVRGNVVVMSYRANRLKNDGSVEDFEAIIKWMRKQIDSAANDNQASTAAEKITVVV